MKYPVLAAIPLCVSLCSVPFARASDGQAGQAKEVSSGQVRAAMRKVADWQLAHPSKEEFNGWIQGAFLAGLCAADRVLPDAGYHEALLRIADGSGWSLGPRVYHADDMCVGQAYLELYGRDRDPRMVAAMRERCDFILAHPRDGSLEFAGDARSDRWSWCDSLFMAPPAWARLYAATGNRAYLDFMIANWWKTTAYLYDPSEHLCFRDSTYFERTEPNGRKIFWSRGNGWVLAGLARVIPILPADDPSRPRFENLFREMAARVAGLQGPGGGWSASLLDPESCSPRMEASGTGFYCFALAWGVNQGLLDRAAYGPRALKAWHALLECVTPEGRLTHVQPVGAAPKAFDPESTEAFGPGAFLLAGCEISRLVETPL
jgi:rhamnogalacturonyl hydrolase YesR